MENDLIEGSPNTLSLAFVEGLYADYLKDPSLVPEDSQQYFDEMQHDASDAGFAREPKLGPSFKTPSLFNPAPPAVKGSNGYTNGHGTNGATNGKSNGHAAAPASWNNGVSEVA